MGVSMALSMNSQRRQLANKWHLSAKLVFRAVKLFALGLFINNGHDLENWRITGVLQVRVV